MCVCYIVVRSFTVLLCNGRFFTFGCLRIMLYNQSINQLLMVKFQKIVFKIVFVFKLLI